MWKPQWPTWPLALGRCSSSFHPTFHSNKTQSRSHKKPSSRRCRVYFRRRNPPRTTFCRRRTQRGTRRLLLQIDRQSQAPQCTWKSTRLLNPDCRRRNTRLQHEDHHRIVGSINRPIHRMETEERESERNCILAQWCKRPSTRPREYCCRHRTPRCQPAYCLRNRSARRKPLCKHTHTRFHTPRCSHLDYHGRRRHTVPTC